MGKVTRSVGLDVHAETIAVAASEGRKQVQTVGTIPNRPEAIQRLMGKLGKPGELRVCYEAGPTGYALYWQLLGCRMPNTKRYEIWCQPAARPRKTPSERSIV